MARTARQDSVRDRIARAHSQKESDQKQALRLLARASLAIGVIGLGLWLGSRLFQDEPPPAPVQPSAPVSTEAEGSQPVAPAPATEPVKPAKPRATPETVAAASRKLEELVQDYSATNRQMPGASATLERITQHQLRAAQAAEGGDLELALQLLTTALREGEALRTAAEDRFKANLGTAEAALKQEDLDTARLHVEQALQQRPESQDARKLAERVDRAITLRGLRQAAEDARIAGRLPAERTVLEQILKVVPGDAAATARIAEISRLEEDRQFGRLVARGLQAVADREVATASAALAGAEKLRPKHADTARLRTGLAELERILTRDRHLADGAEAAFRDDWETARREFDAARVLDPTHDGAVRGGETAARVMATQRTVDDFLARPARLATPAVAETARIALAAAADLMELSPRLQAGALDLEEEIALQQIPVAVTVRSDGQTEIGVRGVGRIGRTESREIELRPGVYVFEGRRAGYRTKLVRLRIVAGSGPIEIEVICDEPA